MNIQKGTLVPIGGPDSGFITSENCTKAAKLAKGRPHTIMAEAHGRAKRRIKAGEWYIGTYCGDPCAWYAETDTEFAHRPARLVCVISAPLVLGTV